MEQKRNNKYQIKTEKQTDKQTKNKNSKQTKKNQEDKSELLKLQTNSDILQDVSYLAQLFDLCE